MREGICRLPFSQVNITYVILAVTAQKGSWVTAKTYKLIRMKGEIDGNKDYYQILGLEKVALQMMK